MFSIVLKNGEYHVHKSPEEIKKEKRNALWRELMAVRVMPNAR